jgi:hypothetical protein
LLDGSPLFAGLSEGAERANLAGKRFGSERAAAMQISVEGGERAGGSLEVELDLTHRHQHGKRFRARRKGGAQALVERERRVAVAASELMAGAVEQRSGTLLRRGRPASPGRLLRRIRWLDAALLARCDLDVDARFDSRRVPKQHAVRACRHERAERQGERRLLSNRRQRTGTTSGDLQRSDLFRLPQLARRDERQEARLVAAAHPRRLGSLRRRMHGHARMCGQCRRRGLYAGHLDFPFDDDDARRPFTRGMPDGEHGAARRR